jgi:hypothetical protein
MAERAPFARRTHHGAGDRYVIGLACAFAILWLLLAIAPGYRADWAIEHVLTGLCVAVLVVSYRRLPLSRPSYTCLVLFLCLRPEGHESGRTRSLAVHLDDCRRRPMARPAPAPRQVAVSVAVWVESAMPHGFLFGGYVVWDAQHDMLAATCGTVIALLLIAAWLRWADGAPIWTAAAERG